MAVRSSSGRGDGYLYIASGDGHRTSHEYVPQHAQDSGTLLGKILRIDVESGRETLRDSG